jgi:4-carboxymuconolactone decarboxylase
MDKTLFEKGLEKRKATLGAEYVEKNLAAADDFTRPFQEAMTAWCWGFGWGDETIDPKTRSMMNLAMIGALGKMHEWETHCRGALTNGVSKAKKSVPSSTWSASIAGCLRRWSASALPRRYWRNTTATKRRRPCSAYPLAFLPCSRIWLSVWRGDSASADTARSSTAPVFDAHARSNADSKSAVVSTRSAWNP